MAKSEQKGNDMEYELINPSDPYTFIAEDFETAALVVLALSPAYGAVSKDGSQKVPVFIFGPSNMADEWYTEQFGRTANEGLEAKKLPLAASLESMMLGGFEDRRRYSAALEAITDEEKRKRFIEQWQDGRSSLNDIGTRAHKIAEWIKTKNKRR